MGPLLTLVLLATVTQQVKLRDDQDDSVLAVYADVIANNDASQQKDIQDQATLALIQKQSNKEALNELLNEQTEIFVE